MIQECHALHTAIFGLGWINFANYYFFTEIVESDGTIEVANYDH